VIYLIKKILYRGFYFMLTLLLITSMTLGCTAKQPVTPGPDPTPTPTPTQPKPPEDTPAPTAEEKDISKYMPMKVGYIWEYEGEGNEYASYTLRVEFQEKNKVQLTRDNGGTVIADIYEVREDSIVHVYQAGESYDHTNLLKQLNNYEDTIIKLPIQVGNKWVSEENSYEIIDTKATITVPYGTFKDCTVIKRTYKDGSEDYLHYKEVIGLLQSEFRSGDFKVFSRLKNFSNK
jgi:hypothetical protein